MDTAYSWLRRSVSKLKITSLPSTAITSATANSNNGSRSKLQTEEEEEEKIYGITEQLIGFVKSFSLETFNSFSLPDEDESSSDGGNLRRDLSDWQETHAMLALSRVKELAQLRFRLCPRYLKERQFWRIYFTLVRSYVSQQILQLIRIWKPFRSFDYYTRIKYYTRYELRAVQLAKIKQMKMGDETVSNSSACEVEMSEAKFTSMETASSMEFK